MINGIKNKQGIHSLIGAVCNNSSYQHPRRVAGQKKLNGVKVFNASFLFNERTKVE